jgi:hypothetical protein
MPDPSPRVKLIEPLESRDATAVYDRQMVNGIVEVTSDTPRLLKRPGNRVAFNGQPGVGQGITNYLNSVYSISGDTLNAFAGTVALTAVQATASAGYQPRQGPMTVGFAGKLWVMGGWVNPAQAIPQFTVAIAGGAVTSITATFNGIGYAPGYPTTVNLSITGGGGSGATATITITGQSVSSIHLTAGGTGYTTPPNATVASNAGWGIMNDVWNSPDGINWAQLASTSPWGQRGLGSAIVFQGKMWIMGGATGSTHGLDTVYQDVWNSTDGIHWTRTTAAAWPGRYRLGLCLFNGFMWVCGGRSFVYPSNNWPNTFYSDCWFSADGGTWTRTTGAAPWVARANHAFYGLGSKLYVVGGTLTDPFSNATSDAWSSPDGITWTRTSSNPFGVVASPVWPVAAITSAGSELTEPPPVTISGGTGGSGATAYCTADVDDDASDTDESQSAGIIQVTFNNVGSGYTSVPGIAFGTTTAAPNIAAYAFLDGTSNGGAKSFRSDVIGGTAYLLEYLDGGAFLHTVWSTTDGITFTNLNVVFPGGLWTPRNPQFFAYGNLWMTAGIDGANNYYNDVWYIPLTAAGTALLPTVPLGFYHFTQTSTAISTPLLVFKSTKDLFSYNASLALLTKLTASANYPATTVPGIVYLDGYFFVMDPQGRIWNSSPNDPSIWNALAFIAMQNEPNGGVAIAKLANYVVGLGQWTTEFFYDGPAPGSPPASPLLPNQSLPFQVGCAAGESVIEMQNSIVWIGQTRREGQGVYMFNDYNPQRISTPFVDRIIQNDPLTSLSAYTLDCFGHSHYILNLNTSNITLVYDFASQVWSIWTSMGLGVQNVVVSLVCDAYGTVTASIPGHNFSDGDPATISGATIPGYNGLVNLTFVDANTVQYILRNSVANNPGTAVAQSYTENFFSPVASTQVKDVDYVQDPLNGIIYSQDIFDYTDNGMPIDLQCQTERWDGGSSMWKFLRRISLLCDITSGNVLLSYSDNDYQTFSTFRTLALNQGQRATTTNCGRFRRRAFKIRHTAATPFRASELEMELIPGDF